MFHKELSKITFTHPKKLLEKGSSSSSEEEDDNIPELSKQEVKAFLLDYVEKGQNCALCGIDKDLRESESVDSELLPKCGQSIRKKYI